ncbi:MAG TPA: hypothetical protein IAA13_01615 [Candidatus Alistipes merdigallinarum]|nr:hypothetical protein [Candidatus Alistipes merdigallinarum]
MKEWLIYLLFANICFAILYLCYRLLMRKQENFALNRWTMISILCVSMLIPLIPMPKWGETGEQSRWFLALRERPIEARGAVSEVKSVSGEESTAEQTFVAQMSEKQTGIKPLTESVQNTGQPANSMQRLENRISVLQVLFWLYIVGVVLCLGRFLFGLYEIGYLLRLSPKKRVDGMRIIVLRGQFSPYSLGRYVVLSEEDYRDDLHEIVLHEKAHCRQGHIYDLVLVSIAEILFWFNPLLKPFRRELSELHEYQADQQVLAQGVDAADYQMLIIKKSVGMQKFRWATHLRNTYCQTRKRIVMMNREKTRSRKRWYALFLVPVVAVLLMSFGNRSEAPSQAAANEVPEGWVVAGTAPQDYQVSVLPEKREGNNVVLLESVANPDPSKFGTLSQYCSADQYLGKRVRMTGYLKSENVKNWAGMWFRVDDSKQKDLSLSFDNMSDRPIKNTTDWKKYEIVLDVPQEAGAMVFGVLLEGSGKVWISDISFEVVDQSVPTTNMVKERAPLPQGPVNLDFAE